MPNVGVPIDNPTVGEAPRKGVVDSTSGSSHHVVTSAGETKHVDVLQRKLQEQPSFLRTSGGGRAPSTCIGPPSVQRSIVLARCRRSAKPAPVVPPSAATGSQRTFWGNAPPMGTSGDASCLRRAAGRAGGFGRATGSRTSASLRDGSPPLENHCRRPHGAPGPAGPIGRIRDGPAGCPWARIRDGRVAHGAGSPAACPGSASRPVHAPAARRAGGWAACPVSLRHGPAPEPRALRVRAAWSVAGPLPKSARVRLAPGFHAARSSAARAQPALAQRVKGRGSAE